MHRLSRVGVILSLLWRAAICQYVQRAFARFGCGIGSKNVAANLPDRGEPVANVKVEGVFERAAQLLRESRAFSRGGDGNLQVAPAHDSREVEITIRRIVDSVAKNSAAVGVL